MEADADSGERSSRSRYNQVMRWIRRAHMYLGLFLLPFVLIYGVTGFLFNHPQVLARFDVRVLGDEPGRRILETLPPPADLARTVVSRLETEIPDRKYSVVDPEDAAYTVTMGFRTYEDGLRHHLVFEAEDWSGEIHSAVPKPARRTPLEDLKKLDIGRTLRDSLVETARSIYEANGHSVGKIDHQWGPQLRFDVETDGERWTMFYNLGNRNIWTHPAEGVEGRNTVRDFLLGLHLAHTYPVHPDVRTVWAVMVDLLSIVMVLWAISGGAMWWQMKNVRRSGAAIITISVIWAIGLSYFMYFAFKAAG